MDLTDTAFEHESVTYETQTRESEYDKSLLPLGKVAQKVNTVVSFVLPPSTTIKQSYSKSQHTQGYSNFNQIL